MSDGSGQNTDRPIIVQNAPQPIDFTPRGGGKAHTRRPDRERQGQRLDGRFHELERLLDGSTNTALTTGLPDSDPELVIVFEVIDSTADLADVFRSIGLEPLTDLEDELDDDLLGDDFGRLRPRGEADEPIKKFVHAAMANEQAVAELIRLWKHWKTGKRMLSGYGSFTNLFKLLFDVRPWGPIDRVRNTGLADRLSEQIEAGLDEVPLNIELWFRTNPEVRQASEDQVASVIERMHGRVLSVATHPEIGFHGIAAQLPAASVAGIRTTTDLTELSQIELLHSPEVLFIRAGGQSVSTNVDAELPTTTDQGAPGPLRDPLLAVLDGLPAANHPHLRGRLEVIDPDDFGSNPEYTVERRRHGTMVVSSAIWGDLNAANQPATRKVVVRPVLLPDLATQNAVEGLPWSELPTDLTIRAVRDVIEAFPTVQVFNVSLGDPFAPFDTIPSAWARAIDWLSYEHNVLFVLSAGNHPKPIPISAAELKSLEGRERDQRMAEVLAGLSANRRLLPPAESLNGLTVASLHSDAGGPVEPLGYLLDPWTADGHPSPTSARGRGIRRAIKPDLAAPGGRQFFSPAFGPSDEITPQLATASPPGIKVAAPPDRIAYVSGTTLAACETARRAADIIDLLSEPETFVTPGHRPVAAKALLVHGASFDQKIDYGTSLDRLVGHGAIDKDYRSGCPSTRATILYTGEIGARQKLLVMPPFPTEIASMRDVRRISMTLAWLSPVNWNHRQYRRAKLTVDGPPEMPSKTRKNLGANYNLGLRGTVQHRSFETDRAFSQDELTLTINCADQAGGLTGAVPFALAVSIEVAESSVTQVYDLVRARIRESVRVRPITNT